MIFLKFKDREIGAGGGGGGWLFPYQTFMFQVDTRRMSEGYLRNIKIPYWVSGGRLGVFDDIDQHVSAGVSGASKMFFWVYGGICVVFMDV